MPSSKHQTLFQELVGQSLREVYAPLDVRLEMYDRWPRSRRYSARKLRFRVKRFVAFG